MKNNTADTMAEPCQPLVPDYRPELVFGLIGPAGTDLKTTFKFLKKALIDVGYKMPKEEIRLSKLIWEIFRDNFDNLSEDKRVEA